MTDLQIKKVILSPPREEEDVTALLSPGVTWPGQFIKISPLPEARLSATIEVKQVQLTWSEEVAGTGCNAAQVPL